MGTYKTFEMALAEDPIRSRQRAEFGIAMHNTAADLMADGVQPPDILAAYIGAMRMLICCVESGENRAAIVEWVVDNLRDGQIEAMVEQRIANVKPEGRA